MFFYTLGSPTLSTILNLCLIIKEFRVKIEKEMSEVLTELLDIIDNSLLRTEGLQIEDKVFYYKT